MFLEAPEPGNLKWLRPFRRPQQDCMGGSGEFRDWQICSFMYKIERAEELLTRQRADLYNFYLSTFIHLYISEIARSWRSLGTSWTRLGAAWGRLGRLGCVLGVSCDLLGRLGISNRRL